MLRSEWDRNHSATRLHRTPEQSDTRETPHSGLLFLVSSVCPSVCEKSVTRWLTLDTATRHSVRYLICHKSYFFSYKSAMTR